MQAKDDAGTSHWAVLLDPNGAAFGIIPRVPAEALPPESYDTTTPIGRIAWLDLTVPGAATIGDFYGQVGGWSVQNVETEDGGEHYADYTMLGENGTPAAGVCHARDVNRDLPPVWMIYLPVGDLAASLRRVQEEGGTVVKVLQGEDGAYVSAAVQDPVGAYLALMPG